MADQSYSYLESINSFPTTKMGSINRLITENSLTRLINRLIDLDGFIITDGLAQKSDDSEIIGNGGKHLKINSNLRVDLDSADVIFSRDIFEFVIRGYYFAVPWQDLVNLILPNPQQTPSETTCLYARIFIDNNSAGYPELIGQKAYEEGAPGTEAGRNYCVQFFTTTGNSKPIPYHPCLDGDGVNPISGLGTYIYYYDLMLLKYFKGDLTVADGLYIPFESMCKFDSHSIDIIDGGELSFKTENN